MAQAPLKEQLSQLAAAARSFSRVGEQWTQGPVGRPADTPAPLNDYLAHLRDVEGVVTDRATAQRRLRRVRYSIHVRDARPRGRRIDDLLVGSSQELPLVWRPDGLKQGSLDALAKTRFVRPAGPPTPSIDAGRLFAATDAAFAGASAFGLGAEAATRVPVRGLVTWVGDLAAWFVEWNRRRVAAERDGKKWTDAESKAELDAVHKLEAPLEAMLGDFDGQVVAASYEAVFGGSLSALPRAADLLSAYYTGERKLPPTVREPRVVDRFALFVKHAVPAIPHTDPGGTTKLTPEATAAIKTYVTRTAALFVYQGSPKRWFSLPSVPTLKAAAQQVEAQSVMFDEIVGRFTKLLSGPLAGGPIPVEWPRTTA